MIHIIWRDDEWMAVTIALMKQPDFANGLPPFIQSKHMAEAMKVLPEERRRKLFNNTNAVYRPSVLRTLERIRATLTDTPLPPPPAPPEPQAVMAPTEKKTRIDWRPHEYVALARELYRMSPSSNYEVSATLAGLSAAEVREAERNVLPADRRRRLDAITSIRARLVEAFKTVRAEVEARQAAVDAARAVSQAGKTEEPAPQPEVETPVPLPEPASVEHVDPYKLALQVLVDMLVPALAERLAPELTKRLTPMLTPAAPAPVPAAPAPAAEQEEDPLESQPPADWTPPPPDALPASLMPPPAPRKTMIAVLGLRPVQMQELRAAFPLFEIVAEQGHHSSKTLKSLQSAERIISATTDQNNMNGMTDKMLAKHFGDKYVRANGGMSMVKRQIQLWINSGVLK